MKWRLIDTAPKDGTPIIGLWGDDGAVQCEWWESPFKHMQSQWNPTSLPSHGCGCCGDSNVQPTHWIPVPELP